MTKQEHDGPCAEETVNGDDNERLQNSKILHVNRTHREGWECFIQHLESIHQFHIDGNYC